MSCMVSSVQKVLSLLFALGESETHAVRLDRVHAVNYVEAWITNPFCKITSGEHRDSDP